MTSVARLRACVRRILPMAGGLSVIICLWKMRHCKLSRSHCMMNMCQYLLPIISMCNHWSWNCCSNRKASIALSSKDLLNKRWRGQGLAHSKLSAQPGSCTMQDHSLGIENSTFPHVIETQQYWLSFFCSSHLQECANDVEHVGTLTLRCLSDFAWTVPMFLCRLILFGTLICTPLRPVAYAPPTMLYNTEGSTCILWSHILGLSWKRSQGPIHI